MLWINIGDRVRSKSPQELNGWNVPVGRLVKRPQHKPKLRTLLIGWAIVGGLLVWLTGCASSPRSYKITEVGEMVLAGQEQQFLRAIRANPALLTDPAGCAISGSVKWSLAKCAMKTGGRRYGNNLVFQTATEEKRLMIAQHIRERIPVGDWPGDSPILKAAVLGHAKAVQSLLPKAYGNYYNHNNHNALMLAIVNKNPGVVKVITEWAAVKNSWSSRGLFQRKSNAEKTSGENALGLALSTGDYDSVRFVTDAMKRLNLSLSVPIWKVAQRGYVDVVQTLLDSGNNPEDFDANTNHNALMVAIINKDQSIVKVLTEWAVANRRKDLFQRKSDAEETYGANAAGLAFSTRKHGIIDLVKDAMKRLNLDPKGKEL